MASQTNPFQIEQPPAPPAQGWQPMWAEDQQRGLRPGFTDGYDYWNALKNGVQRGPGMDGHMGSRVPQTGMILKSEDHPTFWKTMQGEREAGYQPFLAPEAGRIYSAEKATGPLLRDPHDSELAFFEKNPGVGGYASPDGKIVMNPFSGHSPEERRAVMHNELYRLMTRDSILPRFTGELTPQQRKMLASNPFYWKSDKQSQLDTIMGRLISGDPSAGAPSPEQEDYLRAVHPLFEQYSTRAIPGSQE